MKRRQTTKQVAASSICSIQDIKFAAQGRWPEILFAAGFSELQLTSTGQPCPKCNGTDRYSAAKDVAQSGAVFCRQCFHKGSSIKPGDGIASVAWMRDVENGAAAKWVAEQLGLGDQPAEKVSIITAVARDKRMPEASFRLYGVLEATRGSEDRPVARVDVYGASGEVHSYFDLWAGEKGKFKRGIGNSGMFFPGRLPVAGDAWVLVEGVKDASALSGLGFNAAGLPSSKIPAEFAPLFAGVDITIVHDLDHPGMTGAHETASQLFGLASTVAIARLPGPILESKGDDVRDVLSMPNGESLVRDAVSRARTWTPQIAGQNPDGPPQVLLLMEEAEVAEEVITHLGNLGWETAWIPDSECELTRVYVRGETLVHMLICDDIGGQSNAIIRDLPACLVRERITQACALFVERNTNGVTELKPSRPQTWLVDAIYKRGHYGKAIRRLTGIVTTPTMRVDGSIVSEAGYDARTGLIYRPNCTYPAIPEMPTQQDAAKSLAELLGVLVDFPMFDAADGSAWASMVLSMIGRSCIDGHVPLFAVTANIRGAGKSLLVDAATLIAYGRQAARKAFTRDENEMRKVITAVAMVATPSVLFDNVDIQLGGASLDAALTSAVWSDRILGLSRMTGDLPMRTIWSATGNNMAFGSDIGRRVLPIRLQSALETPEDRSGFVHPELLAWIESRRPELAVAALTILRAYFVAGCPVQQNGEWGSFESWSSRIRGAIVWAGGADPLPTRMTALAGDDTAALLRKLIAGIEQADPSGIGLTTKEIEQKTFGHQADYSEHESLAEAVFEICGERFNGRTFGRRIRGYLGRVHGGKFIDASQARGGVLRYRVRPAGGGLGGFGGSDSTPRSIVSRSIDTATNPQTSPTSPERSQTAPPNQPNPPVAELGTGSEIEL